MPKVSIIVPVYNVEQYLQECLESIVKQTLQDIEIICINDGSTDDSLKIIKQYAQKDTRIQIIDKPNAGYGHSMNLGFAAAKGEYIGIVESDDFIDANMFEELYSMAKTGDADIVKSDWYNYFTKTRTSTKNGRVCDYNSAITNVYEHPEMLCTQPSIWSAIYKREFVQNTGVKFLETPGASYQDTSVSFKLFCLAGRVLFTTKAYLYYRQDNVNSSINNSSKALVLCKEFEEIDKFLDENKEIKNAVLTQKLIAQYKAYRWTIKRIARQHRKEFIHRISEEFARYVERNDITQDALERIGDSKLNNLVKNPDLFLKRFEMKSCIEKWRAFRRSIISIRLNTSRVSIKLFGKQIVNIG